MAKPTASIRFKTRLQRPAKPADADWLFFVLPPAASDRLPTRSQVGVEGTLGGQPFQVTLDPDGTLYVPSVRGAATLPIDDVSDTLMELRMKAMRHDFRAHELDGANITVSLNFDEAIVLVAPLVLWPQLCMVSAGSVLSELRPGPDGTPRTVRVVHLGLAYDHRVINGRLAAAFLGRLRTTLEDPGTLLDD